MAVIIGTAAAETLAGTAGKDTIDAAGGNAGNGFKVILATLKTVDAIAVGQDVIVGR